MPGDASVGRAAGDRRDEGREPASVARGVRCFSAVFDRSFNGASFDAHDCPVTTDYCTVYNFFASQSQRNI